MSWIPAKPKCDVCGVEKKETNHWWQMWVDESTDLAPKDLVDSLGLAGIQHHGKITIQRFNSEGQVLDPKYKSLSHACSEKCLMQFISTNLSKL